MAFSLYALMGPNTPKISNESLFIELEARFENAPDFSIEFERLPFSKTNTLALRWDSWLARVAYEEGDQVIEDSVEIERRRPDGAPSGISQITRRIRVVFSSDDEKVHTNEIIAIMDFLSAIDDIFIYDPQQNDFVV